MYVTQKLVLLLSLLSDFELDFILFSWFYNTKQSPEILKLVGEILYLLAEPDLLETDIDSFPVNILLVFKTSETRFRDTS